jgi:hypothetical protein
MFSVFDYFVACVAGTNIQTNEEVAIKLVSFLHSLVFRFFSHEFFLLFVWL